MTEQDYDWPDSLIEEVADRRAVFVLGAGTSMGATADGGKTPPSWKELLTQMCDRIGNPNDKKFAANLIDADLYLDAAQIIRDKLDPAEFSRISREKFSSPQYQASNIHELIHQIDPKIVITTNYDSIYETYCKTTGGGQTEGYNVCKYYDKHALNDLRSPTRSILKIHGCESDPTSIVLSRSDYFRARRDAPHFYSILDSIFLLNTTVFVGCSLADPDLKLILENANLSSPSEHSHYALMPKGEHPSIREMFHKTYNLRFVEYENSDKTHANASNAIEHLKDRVLEFRIERNQP